MSDEQAGEALNDAMMKSDDSAVQSDAAITDSQSRGSREARGRGGHGQTPFSLLDFLNVIA